MLDPLSIAWAYPLFGLLHLLRHPHTLAIPIQTLTTSYFKSTTLFQTLLKTFILTTVLTAVLILALFKITDHLLFLVARSFGPLDILAKNSWVRGAVVLVGVAVQGALIAGRVVEYGVGEGARRVGGGVLCEKMGKVDLKRTALPAGVSGEEVKSAVMGGGKGGVMTAEQGVGGIVKNPVDTVKSVGGNVEKTLQGKGVQMVVKRLVSIPAAAVPVVGPVVYAVMNSGDLGGHYLEGYARSAGVEREMQENKGSVKAFGIVAGILHALPVVGPVFYFSNFVGSALFIADLKACKEKQGKQN